MRDSAFWKSTNHNGFINLQVLATPRVEIAATTMVNSMKGAIGGLMFDPSILPGQPAGLDFILESTSMSGFSALNLRQVAQSVGVNYRAGESLMLNTAVVYNDWKDRQPYLYDSTGRYVSVLAGINWTF